MAPTWREDRPEAITAASHSAVRPSRSMVTIFSALSSSSEARMRFSRSLCGAVFAAAAGAAGFLAAGFLGAVSWRVFLTDFLAGFCGFLCAGPFWRLSRFLAGGLFDGFAGQGSRSFAVRRRGLAWPLGAAPRAWARSSVELSAERGPSSTTSEGAEPQPPRRPKRRARGACSDARTEPGRRTTAMGIRAAIAATAASGKTVPDCRCPSAR